MSNSWWRWGRYLYGIPLAFTGLIYLLRPQTSVESLTSFIPGGLALIYVAGALWLVLGFLIAFNIRTTYATWGVIGLICAYLIMVHVPAAYAGQYLAIVWFELLRDVSLMGGAFFIMAAERSHEQKEEHHGHQERVNA